MSKPTPPWWPTADAKRHADAGCAHEWRDGHLTGCRFTEESDQGDTEEGANRAG